jgi:hypothetical protein
MNRSRVLTFAVAFILGAALGTTAGWFLGKQAPGSSYSADPLKVELTVAGPYLQLSAVGFPKGHMLLIDGCEGFSKSGSEGGHHISAFYIRDENLDPPRLLASGVAVMLLPAETPGVGFKGPKNKDVEIHIYVRIEHGKFRRAEFERQPIQLRLCEGLTKVRIEHNTVEVANPEGKAVEVRLGTHGEPFIPNHKIKVTGQRVE